MPTESSASSILQHLKAHIIRPVILGSTSPGPSSIRRFHIPKGPSTGSIPRQVYSQGPYSNASSIHPTGPSADSIPLLVHQQIPYSDGSECRFHTPTGSSQVSLVLLKSIRWLHDRFSIRVLTLDIQFPTPIPGGPPAGSILRRSIPRFHSPARPPQVLLCQAHPPVPFSLR